MKSSTAHGGSLQVNPVWVNRTTLSMSKQKKKPVQPAGPGTTTTSQGLYQTRLNIGRLNYVLRDHADLG